MNPQPYNPKFDDLSLAAKVDRTQLMYFIDEALASGHYQIALWHMLPDTSPPKVGMRLVGREFPKELMDATVKTLTRYIEKLKVEDQKKILLAKGPPLIM